jgi:iron complex transport system permease protein
MTTSSSLSVRSRAPRAGTPQGAVFGALGALLLVACLGSVALGAGDFTTDDVLRTVGARLGVAQPLAPLRDSVVWELRLPRVLLAAAVGAGLAASGAVLQAVTRNALADPYLLGVSSGASTGAVLVLVLGVGSGVLSLAAGALLGGLASFGLVLLLLGRGSTGSGRLVLTGVVVGQLFTAITSLIIISSGDADSTRSILYWLLGSLAPARWPAVVATGAVVVVALVVFRFVASGLDALAFGENAASALGVNVARTRIVAIVMAAALTAVMVASVGAIGFVGLIVPHAVRMLVGSEHRSLIPASALAGAVFLVAADALGRSVFAPQQIPVGVVTSLLGVPVFLLIARRREASR